MLPLPNFFNTLQRYIFFPINASLFGDSSRKYYQRNRSKFSKKIENKHFGVQLSFCIFVVDYYEVENKVYRLFTRHSIQKR